MSSVLITSTMKSDPGMPLTRASSRGVPVSASAALPEGGSAEGALGACATTSAERTGAIAVAAPAATTPVRNLRRSAFGPGSLRDMVSSSSSASPGGDSNPGLLCLRFHGAQAPPRLADQRARFARAPLHRPFGAGGQLLHRADRGPSPWIRQHPDPAADRASDPARHRAHARPLHLRDQRAPVLVRRVLRQGILGRGILVGVLRRDRLCAHLLGGERPRLRPAAHRRDAARGAPLAESAGLPRANAVISMPYVRFAPLFPRSRLGTLGIIQRCSGRREFGYDESPQFREPFFALRSRSRAGFLPVRGQAADNREGHDPLLREPEGHALAPHAQPDLPASGR